MLLNYGVGKDSWESLGSNQSILKEISPEYSLEGLCWSWNSNTLATSCEESTHWKRSWCRERLKAGGEGDNRGLDGWMASPTQRVWVWVKSGSWWWTGRPGVLQSMGSQRVRHNWVTWTEMKNWVGELGPIYCHFLGEGNGNPLQCSCLENPMDGGAW